MLSKWHINLQNNEYLLPNLLVFISDSIFWSWMWGVYWCPCYLCTKEGRGSRCHRLSNGSHLLRSWHTCHTTQQQIFSSTMLDLNRVSQKVKSYPSSQVKLRTLLIGASVLPMANGRRGTGIGHDVAEREEGTIIGEHWLQNTKGKKISRKIKMQPFEAGFCYKMLQSAVA